MKVPLVLKIFPLQRGAPLNWFTFIFVWGAFQLDLFLHLRKWQQLQRLYTTLFTIAHCSWDSSTKMTSRASGGGVSKTGAKRCNVSTALFRR